MYAESATATLVPGRAPSLGMKSYARFRKSQRSIKDKSRGIFLLLNMSMILLSLNMTETSFEIPPKSLDRKINKPFGVTPIESK